VAKLNHVWQTSRCECDFPCPPPSLRCIQMERFSLWVKSACTPPLSDSCQTLCDTSKYLGLEKFVFSYVMKTFGSRMLHHPITRSHPMSMELRSLFLNSSYFDFPFPIDSLHKLKSLWMKYNGDHCIQFSVNDLMNALSTRLRNIHREINGISTFIRSIRGKTFRDAIWFDQHSKWIVDPITGEERLVL
jgi:hypothetical protein